MLLFQTKIRVLGNDIYRGTIKPIQRSLTFADKFSDEIKGKTQLQRFLGCLNYVSDFFPHLKQLCAPLYSRLRKNPKPWSPDKLKMASNLYHVCISAIPLHTSCLLYTSPSPRDRTRSRMPSSA